MGVTLSRQQIQIVGWFRDGKGNLVVRARAGTGKTFTILLGVNEAPDDAILILAFGKRIQLEIAGKVTNPNAVVQTAHALGRAAVVRYWENIRTEDKNNRGARARSLAEQACGMSAPDAMKKLVASLVTKGREMAPFAVDGSELREIAVQFDCVPDDEWIADGFDLEWVCGRTVEAMQIAAEVKPNATGIDYADMLFLPLRNKWLRPKYGLVVIDEAQDMNLTQLALAQGVCRKDGRIAIVGDDRQGIYRFRGADSTALDRLKTALEADELGLTVTYRCGRKIVELAKVLVPDYEAAPDSHEGSISEAPAAAVLQQAKPGDFILSRKNAPLVAIALGLIRRDIRTKIEGRDIGAGLISITRKLATGAARNSVPKWLEKLKTWKDREIKRAEEADLEAKIELVKDQYETLIELSDGVAGIPELLTRLENMFADTDKDNRSSYVVCSSVHRAKGLEADRVFVLRDTLNPPVACLNCRQRHGAGGKSKTGCATYVPDPLAEREEQNIAYVAITRAKNELVWLVGEFASRRA